MYTVADCLYQFTLTGQQQRKHAFHSSNFPFNYYSNETCIYQFFVSGYDSENVICFRFYRFDVGSDNVNCTDDYLTFSGNDLRYCGSGGLALSKRNLVPTAYHNIWSDQFCCEYIFVNDICQKYTMYTASHGVTMVVVVASSDPLSRRFQILLCGGNNGRPHITFIIFNIHCVIQSTTSLLKNKIFDIHNIFI